MITPAALDETGGEYSSEPKTQVKIPITDINLALVRKMKAARSATLNAETVKLFGKPSAYQVGPGDVLQITVWDHPEIAAALGAAVAGAARPADAAPGFVVDYAGNVQFPYAGTIHVAGDDVTTIQRKLHTKLSNVFNKPEVTVRVESFRSAQVYIDGEVRAPGAQPINDIPMTLTEAVNRAGGFTPNADQSRVELQRDGVTYPIDVASLMTHDHNPQRIVLRKGDMLHIASRDDNGIYLMGEVNRPATVMPMRNGHLTLAEALSQAGSMNPNTADAKQLFVIRGSTGAEPQIFHLDALSPVSMLLANQFEMQPKDIVFVDNNTLVRLNRVLNLFLPAINAGLTGALVTK